MDIQIINYDHVNQDATIMFHYKENVFTKECRIDLMKDILKRFKEKAFTANEEDEALFNTIISNGGIEWLKEEVNNFDIL